MMTDDTRTTLYPCDARHLHGADDMPARLRAVACGIAEGNANDPDGVRVRLIREAANEIDRLLARNGYLEARAR